jgi:hypothetical protein
MQEDGNREKGWWEAHRAHHNTWTRSYLMTDVRRTLHAKPLGVSKTWSAHPGQQGSEQERTIGKWGWRRWRKKTRLNIPVRETLRKMRFVFAIKIEHNGSTEARRTRQIESLCKIHFQKLQNWSNDHWSVKALWQRVHSNYSSMWYM